MHGVWSGGGGRPTMPLWCRRARVGTRIRDMRPWASIDGLVASGTNRCRAVLCSGSGLLHFIISMIFTHPNFETRNGDIFDVQNSTNIE
jgi:hypothetical protein